MDSRLSPSRSVSEVFYFAKSLPLKAPTRAVFTVVGLQMERDVISCSLVLWQTFKTFGGMKSVVTFNGLTLHNLFITLFFGVINMSFANAAMLFLSSKIIRLVSPAVQINWTDNLLDKPLTVSIS